MYDKVNLIIPRSRDTPDIGKYLSKGIQQTNIKTGEINIFGSMEGLKVSIFTGCIHITGSLSRLLYPNNIFPLDIHSTKEALEKLSDNLHLDIGKAQITGLEYGIQFYMSRPPDDYLPLLGSMPRLQRISLNTNSLYYKPRGKQQIKEFVFYDKKADAIAKDMVIPVGFEDANLLKYEMRLKGRISQQLKIPDITASTLYDPTFYRLLMKRYQDSYFSIAKINKLKTDSMNEIQTVSDALDMLFARLISQSKPDEINGFLDDLKQRQVFKDRKYYTRLKNKIQEITNKGGATIPDDLIKELDDEIKNVGAYV